MRENRRLKIGKQLETITTDNILGKFKRNQKGKETAFAVNPKTSKKTFS